MRRRLVQREEGVAMVLVVFLIIFLVALGLTLIETVRTDSDRSSQHVRRSTALQAAEAGLGDYLAKLVDDHYYYVHYVHAGESTRREPGGTTVAAGSTWTYDLTWTYPSGKDAWRSLNNGYEYNLQITAPSIGTKAVTILATGRRVGNTDTSSWRVVQALVRPSSIADFFRIVNGNVSWGAGATTNGKIYANGNITHDGTATANIYAEGQITGSTTLQNGATKYDVDSNPNIRSQIKNPVNFNDFVVSFVDVQLASQGTPYYLDTPSVDGWRLTFQSDGTFLVQSCTRTSGKDIADVAPTCGSTTTRTVPSNGAIYTAQSAIVSGTVNGRVTVASNDDIVIANNISYVSTQDDVLGLAAKNDVVIARWTPSNLTWGAGVLAQSGTWKTFASDGSHGTMTFTGSSATNLGGDMTMFVTRIYAWDPTLEYLPPPWFPTVEDPYKILLYRELPAG